MRLFAVALAAALLTAPAAASADPGKPLAFRSVAPGVWKATLGTPEDLTLLSAAGASPDLQGLGAMISASFPLAADAGIGRLAASRVALRFPLALDEDVYGLGVDFASMRRTGLSFQLHVDHWNGRTGRTHAPVPFYVSTKRYGVFIDSSRYLTVSVGLGVRTAAAVKPPPIDRTTHANE
jgi:Galactose mutarotase-like